jgi:aspartate-semialdehyde dehydrogenase
MAAVPGVVIQDDPARNVYPMPINAWGTDAVYVGRIRRDFSVENGINFWCVADNLRKGAATNAVQIAEYLLAKHWI